jgi:hypothetical protein
MSNETLFYVQDSRTYCGNCVFWWAKDHKGYTCDLDKAHVFTAEELSKCASRDTDIPWPKDEMDTLAYRHVDMQRLRRLP